MPETPYGPIRVRHDSMPSVLAVLDGPGIPTVTVLIGGTITVDGRKAVTDPGIGSPWDPRRSARTSTVKTGTHRYELRPTGLRRARLRRDSTPIARARGTLRAYNPFRSWPGIDATLTWTPDATPQDVAIGQAMVLALGAGAPGALIRIATFWLDWFS